MRGFRRADAVSVLGALALSWVNSSSGKLQLVMEENFFMATSACEGLSCRKQIVGANETFGLAAHQACSKGETYGVSIVPPTTNLFELAYNCREGGEDGPEITSKEACGISSVCLDASTTPETSEVTYQIAFEFTTDPGLAHDVMVEVKLFFSYMEVNETIYASMASNPVRCELNETCHRGCTDDERLFTATLEDEMGDGWNAGAINLLYYFYLDRGEVNQNMTMPNEDDRDDATLADARSASYSNTLPGGVSRTIPLCLADGEYQFSTGSPNASIGSDAFGGEGSWPESSWTFCAQTGALFDSAIFHVQDGVCAVMNPEPTVTPVEGIEASPSPTTPYEVGASPAPTTLYEVEASLAPTTLHKVEASPAPTTLHEVGASQAPTTLHEVGASQAPTTHHEVGASQAPTTLREVGASQAPTTLHEVGASQAPTTLHEVGASPAPTKILHDDDYASLPPFANHGDESTIGTPAGDGTDSGNGGLETWQMLAISCGAVVLVGITAVVGKVGQINGWFGRPELEPLVVSMSGGGELIPDPNFDEFTP